MARESLKREVSITSFGAAGGSVTGSCHLFESGDSGVVIDMGIFQGRNDLAKMKRKKARGSDILERISQDNPPVLLTHSHIDHIGYLPVYCRQGHTPIVYGTKETIELMEANLSRSARAQRKYAFKNSFFYELEDVKKILDHVQIVEPFEEIPITKDKKISATFCLNGHTLDGSSILLKDRSSGKNILFTGDVGRPIQLLSGGYNRFSGRFPQDPIDVLVTESTCFPDTPIPFKDRISMFQNEINAAFQRGNCILMPCIQHRYMENLEIINNSQKEGTIPRDITFYRDGPALADIDSIYKRYKPDYFTTRYGDEPNYYKLEDHKNRFWLDNLKTILWHDQSLSFFQDIVKRGKKTIIFTSGGMGEDGRTINYLKNGYTNSPERTVIFSCFQVEGTVGEKLLKQQHDPKYRGAKVVKLEGGSSHATGADEIFGYHQRFNLTDLRKIVIVHGSDESRKLMESGLKKTVYGEYAEVILPDIDQRVSLN